MLRIHVIQAKKLIKRDLTITGQLTSDPYAVLSIGDQECRTQIIERTLKPKWDYWCEVRLEKYFICNCINKNECVTILVRRGRNKRCVFVYQFMGL